MDKGSLRFLPAALAFSTHQLERVCGSAGSFWGRCQRDAALQHRGSSQEVLVCLLLVPTSRPLPGSEVHPL